MGVLFQAEQARLRSEEIPHFRAQQEELYTPVRQLGALLLALGSLAVYFSLLYRHPDDWLILFPPGILCVLWPSYFLILMQPPDAGPWGRSFYFSYCLLFPLAVLWTSQDNAFTLMPAPMRLALLTTHLLLLALMASHWRNLWQGLLCAFPLAVLTVTLHPSASLPWEMLTLTLALALCLLMGWLLDWQGRLRYVGQRIQRREKDSGAQPDLRQLHNQVQHAAYHDALTGLPNRYHCMTHLSGQLQKIRLQSDIQRWSGQRLLQPATGTTTSLPRRSSGSAQLAVILLALDEFKPINDRYGYHTGDLLLQHVAERLRSLNPQPAYLARMGGDEFVVIRSCHNTAELKHWQRYLMENLHRPYVLAAEDNKELALTIRISAGTAIAPLDGQLPDHLLSLAEHRMYKQKLHLTSESTGDPA